MRCHATSIVGSCPQSAMALRPHFRIAAPLHPTSIFCFLWGFGRLPHSDTSSSSVLLFRLLLIHSEGTGEQDSITEHLMEGSAVTKSNPQKLHLQWKTEISKTARFQSRGTEKVMSKQREDWAGLCCDGRKASCPMLWRGKKASCPVLWQEGQQAAYVVTVRERRTLEWHNTKCYWLPTVPFGKTDCQIGCFDISGSSDGNAKAQGWSTNTVGGLPTHGSLIDTLGFLCEKCVLLNVS